MRNAIVTAALASMVLGGPDPAAIKVQGPDVLGTAVPVVAVQSGSSGLVQTQVSVTATGSTGVVTATMPAVAGKTNYITGISVSGSGATTSTSASLTLTNVIGTPIVWDFLISAGAGAGATNFQINFTYPLAGTATNTAVTLSESGFGAGATAANVTIHGFTQ